MVVASMVVLSKRVTGPGSAFWYRYQVAIMLTHDGGVVNNL